METPRSCAVWTQVLCGLRGRPPWVGTAVPRGRGRGRTVPSEGATFFSPLFKFCGGNALGVCPGRAGWSQDPSPPLSRPPPSVQVRPGPGVVPARQLPWARPSPDLHGLARALRAPGSVPTLLAKPRGPLFWAFRRSGSCGNKVVAAFPSG